MPLRLKALTEWLQQLPDLGEFDIEPASDDASFRRYFRVKPASGDSLIAMDAPPDKEDSEPFARIAKAFSQLGIHVPEIHALDLEQGFMLLSDLGSTHFLDVLTEETVDDHYADAMDSLISLQSCGQPEDLPPYNQQLLINEMQLFRDWLINKHLNIELTPEQNQMLDQLYQELAQNALLQPQVCVHRDFHSRNLLVAQPNPGIIDFQDAVCGPVTYDLASLLRDCYIAWPRDKVKTWVQGYYDLALQAGILNQEHQQDFLRWFDLMAVQRHLKAAGIFARLNIRDGKPRYLADIPRTLNYVLEIEPEYPQLQGLSRLISEQVLPRL